MDRHNTKDSEGEELIREFFEDIGIEVVPKKIIPYLQDDNKEFREADFYLPRYNLYVEFLGKWNNPDDKRRYKQKMAVYYKNNIPCVYLWPDNLGTLDWILKRRIRETLLRYKMWWYLFKHEFDQYSYEHGLFLLLIIVGIYYVNDPTGKLMLSLFLLLVLWQSVMKSVRTLRKLKTSKFVSNINKST